MNVIETSKRRSAEEAGREADRVGVQPDPG